MMVLFPSPEAREEAMRRFPVEFDGHSIRLEKPELGFNRFTWRSACFAQLSATGFPIEHWDEGGIRTAFRSIGSVCCIDPLCFNELDYSAVRLVIRLEHARDVPYALLVRDFDGSSATEVRIRVVRVWACDSSGSSPTSSHFDCVGGAGPGSSPRAGPRETRLSDIDDESLPGAPQAAAPSFGPHSALMALWRRMVERRRTGISSTMRNFNTTPASNSMASDAPARTPTVLWDMVLARRLAAQFPDAGLDVAQVGTAALSPPSLLLPPPPAHPPLLLQWYDTLAIPATPVIVDAAPEADEAADLDRSVPAPLQGFNALGEEHEDAARK
jgi:hypothetical protein